MLITVLSENSTHNNELEAEHGLCLYVKTKLHNILFDTGQTDLYIKNSKKLGINLEDVDSVIISHGHYDHTGGLKSFLEINAKAKVYINKNSYENLYNNNKKYIGIDRKLIGNSRFIETDDFIKIDEELILFTANQLNLPFDTQSKNLYVLKDNEYKKDTYQHEQYLIINDGEKNVLFSGCSHKGILNILKFSKGYNPYAIIGGFHFMKIETDCDGKAELSLVAKKMDEYDVKYYTCHCTGITQYEFIKTILKNKLKYISVGDTISI